jgi:ABC-type sugar transport system permease subunit
MNRLLPRTLMAPAVIALVLWMLAPLLMSIYFSFVNYNLMQPGERTFNGLANFSYFITADFGSRGGKATARRLLAGADERARVPKR